MQPYITYAFTTWLSVWLSADTYSGSVLLRLTEKTDPVEAQNSSLIILQLERLYWIHAEFWTSEMDSKMKIKFLSNTKG